MVKMKLSLERSLRNERYVPTASMEFDHALVVSDLIQMLAEGSGCRCEEREGKGDWWGSDPPRGGEGGLVGVRSSEGRGKKRERAS